MVILATNTESVGEELTATSLSLLFRAMRLGLSLTTVPDRLKAARGTSQVTVLARVV